MESWVLENRREREKDSKLEEMPAEKAYQGKVVGVGIPRTDVVIVGEPTTHVRLKSPDIQLALSFEQQIRDIDAAINGEEIDVHSKPRKEEILTRKEIMQRLTDVARVKEERVSTNGPVQEAQHHTTIFKAQSPSITHGKLQDAC